VIQRRFDGLQRKYFWSPLVTLRHPLESGVSPDTIGQTETEMTELMQVAGVALGLWGNYLVGQRRRSAFVVWGASNVFCVAVNVLAGLYIMASLFVVYLGFCVHNYILWSRNEVRRGTA